MEDIVSQHFDEAKAGCPGDLKVFVQWNRSVTNLTGVEALCGRGNLGGILSSLSSFSDVVGEWRMGREREHGCQMAIARFLDRMCLALRASKLWLRYAVLQRLIPSFPWIAPGWRAWRRNPRKGRDHMLPSCNTGRERERERKPIKRDIPKWAVNLSFGRESETVAATPTAD